MEDLRSVNKVAADKVPELHRRDVLARLGRAAGYAAPVSVAMLSMKASATSVV